MNSLSISVSKTKFFKRQTILKLPLLLLFISTTVFACHKQKIVDDFPPSVTASPANSQIAESDTNSINASKADADWKEFKDSKLGISFSYPPNLKIERLADGVRLFHEIKFEHLDPCDNSGEAKTLKNFADFDVTISINPEKTEVPPLCQNAQISRETDSELDDECFVSNNLKGRIISARYQGCGDLKYVFALTDGKTLEIKRELVGIFGVGADPEDKKSAEKLSGVILREENNRIFYKFISSLKIDK